MSWLAWGIPLMILGLAIALVPLLHTMRRQPGLIRDEEQKHEAAKRDRWWGSTSQAGLRRGA